VKEPLADWQERARVAGYRFKCPICGNIATPADFKALGLDPQLAAQECIGRHVEGSDRAFRNTRAGPCNFAAYGLLRFHVVVDQSGKEIGVMPVVAPAAEAAPAPRIPESTS
jgi:hypothetical protein